MIGGERHQADITQGTDIFDFAILWIFDGYCMILLV